MNENSTQIGPRAAEMFAAAKTARATMDPRLADPIATWLAREALSTVFRGDDMPSDLEALHAARAINGGAR